MFGEDALQVHPLDDSLEQREGTDVIGTELEAVGLSVFAWEDFPFGAAWRGRRAIGEGLLFGHCGSPTDGQRRSADVRPEDQEW